MPSPASGFKWPVAVLPAMQVAGRFPMGDNSRGVIYIASRHVLHQHDYHAEFRLGSRLFAIEPGDFTITPANVKSSYELPANGYHFCVHFKPVPAQRQAVRLPVFWRPGRFSHFLTERFHRVIELFRRSQCPGPQGTIAGIAANTACQELLTWVAYASTDSGTSRGDSRAEQAVSELVRILDTRCGEPWTIPSLAEHAGLSQNYLAQLFRHRMGTTIQRYLLRRRVELAAHLLSTTRLSIKEVGALAGLSDPQYFNKQFRKVMGMSPSAARTGQG